MNDQGRDAERRRALEVKTEHAEDRLRELRVQVDASDNVVHERVERHLEEAEIAVRDVRARILDMPADGTHDRHELERAVRSLRSEVAFVEAKLEAARAEEADEPGRMLRAEREALAAQVQILEAVVGRGRSEP
jgi:undecaprenyl pyrophosphate synthase